MSETWVGVISAHASDWSCTLNGSALRWPLRDSGSCMMIRGQTREKIKNRKQCKERRSHQQEYWVIDYDDAVDKPDKSGCWLLTRTCITLVKFEPCRGARKRSVGLLPGHIHGVRFHMNDSGLKIEWEHTTLLRTQGLSSVIFNGLLLLITSFLSSFLLLLRFAQEVE
ncbi:hypothetical protein BGW36DRAFT_125649 [Talaromyces proteolyticus]|uniref:Transmembrane protein n=1 Tax=Talaromyces proteolyticus TaxID=1131652 RepID=A0AAD4PXN9_9EURO|nr:uncharacterized protein BGW36DRAFT_125649 [Talaromyces proteolyticus]KAH8700265.1 hypothetical protein BGW36DRAFT_125649 [Talaromyces proteolyticus]